VRLLPRRVGAASSIAPTGDLYVDLRGDIVRLKDEVAARVNEAGTAVDGGCIKESAPPWKKDGGATPIVAGDRVGGLANELVLAFGDARSGALASGRILKNGLSHEECLSAFLNGSAAPVPAALARDPVAPPVIRLDEPFYDAGIVTMPIHVVDQGGGATVLKIDRRATTVADAGEVTEWRIPAGGTPPEGKPYTWGVARDAGYSSSYISATACNAIDGGLCSDPANKSPYINTR